MTYDDPETMQNALAAFKSGIDMIRSTFGLIEDVKGILPDTKEKQAIEASLNASETQLLIAEAQIAQSLGYTLCRCDMPPTPMFKIGYRDSRSGKRDFIDVHECPKCHQNDAGPWQFSKTVGDGG